MLALVLVGLASGVQINYAGLAVVAPSAVTIAAVEGRGWYRYWYLDGRTVFDTPLFPEISGPFPLSRSVFDRPYSWEKPGHEEAEPEVSRLETGNLRGCRSTAPETVPLQESMESETAESAVAGDKDLSHFFQQFPFLLGFRVAVSHRMRPYIRSPD